MTEMANAMMMAAVEALAERLEGAELTLTPGRRDGETADYRAILDDGSQLDLHVDPRGGPTARMHLTPKGLVNEVFDLARIDDSVWTSLFRPYARPLHVADVPTMTRFIDRAREACLAQGDGPVVLPASSAAPSPR